MKRAFLTKIVGNTSTLAVFQIIDKVLHFFLVVILVRILSEQGFGQYSFVNSFVVLFNLIVSLGLAKLCTREISRDPRRSSDIITAALVPIIFSSSIAFIIIRTSIILTKAGQTDVIIAVQLASVSMVLRNFAFIFDAIPKAHERMIYTAIPKQIADILLFLFCLYFLYSGADIIKIFWIVLLTSFIQLIFSIIFSTFVFGVLPSMKIDVSLIKKMLMEAYPLALTSAFVVIYYRIDTVMLSYMKNDYQVAMYALAYSLAFTPLFIAKSFHMAVFPVLSKLFVKSSTKLLIFYQHAVKYLIIAALPLATGLAFLSERFIIIIYGSKYQDSVVLVQILSIALALMFVNGLMGETIIAAGNQKILMRIVGFACLLNIVANFLLIPKYGFHAAAWTTVASELFANIASWAFLWKRYKITALIQDIFRPIICCGTMAIFIHLCSAMSLFIIIPGAIVIYCGMLYFTKAIGPKDTSIIKDLLSKEKR